MNKQPPGRASRDHLQVMLSCAPLGLIRAKARDIDLNGMTVDTGVVSLARDTEVEITLSLCRDDITLTRKLAASVVECAGGTGAKLSFHPYGQDTFDLLQQFISIH